MFGIRLTYVFTRIAHTLHIRFTYASHTFVYVSCPFGARITWFTCDFIHMFCMRSCAARITKRTPSSAPKKESLKDLKAFWDPANLCSPVARVSQAQVHMIGDARRFYFIRQVAQECSGFPSLAKRIDPTSIKRMLTETLLARPDVGRRGPYITYLEDLSQ